MAATTNARKSAHARSYTAEPFASSPQPAPRCKCPRPVVDEDTCVWCGRSVTDEAQQNLKTFGLVAALR
jgi:hypothetical protein